MNRIEFIGSSGVGKTTLLNKVCEIREHQDIWVTPFELKTSVINRFKTTKPFFRKRNIFIILLKLNIFQKKHPKFINQLLQELKTKALDKKLKFYEGLIDLIVEGFAEKKNMNPVIKMNYVEYYLNQVKDIVLLDYIAQNKTVVFEEAIIHNNPKTLYRDDYIRAINSYSSDPNIINPIGIIYCTLPLHEYVKRRKDRIRARGKANFMEKNLTGQQFIELCKSGLSAAKAKADVMRHVGIPVLEINTSEKKINNNEIKTLNFIRDIHDNLNLNNE